jgi:hypothetical protein
MLRDLSLTGGIGKKTANSTPVSSFKAALEDRVMTYVTSV